MSEIHETTTYVPPTNDDWWIARLLAVKAAWAADQERLRVAEARLVEVEQALRDNVAALVWALGEVRAWADDEVNEADYQRACEANSAARAVLDKGEEQG